MKNHTLIVLLCAACGAAILTGCVSEEFIWGGKKAVRQPDGTVLVNKDTGAPYYEKEQNHLERFSHLNDLELNELHVKADGDSYEAHLGQLGSFTGSNTIGVINASLGGATKLVAECGVLYAKIAGGATVDVASAAVGKMVKFFQSNGGNVDQAKAELVDGKVQISDGTTCVTCDKAGNCTTGNCSTGTCPTGNCADTPALN